MSKTITLLGSTGSIGTQCLDVARDKHFEVSALVANANLDLLEKQTREFKPKVVITADENRLSELKLRLKDLPVDVRAGAGAIEDIAATDRSDIVVNAITGIAGLRPTLSALGAGNQLALANKEALITGGELVMNTAKDNGVEIYPIDSEHSAIWQSMRSGQKSEVKGIILTASGGPFFGRSYKELEDVTVEQALNHPNWSMGRKITIDSATLMNKGLEFLEAMWLFDLDPDEIEVVVHRESVVHSAVEFIDGSVIAQLGTPDMRVAIQYALTYPERQELAVKRLSLTDYGRLTFAKPDYKTFTCLATCIDAAKKGGLVACAANGANEQAVELFLNRKIRFNDIGRLVCEAAENLRLPKEVNLENIEMTDQLAREYVIGHV